MGKVCFKCQTEQPKENYHKRSRSADGLNKACKSCRKEEGKARAEQIRAYNKIYHQNKYATVKKNAALKHKFGITLQEYEDLFSKQGGTCCICFSKSDKMLSVDHNHKTKEVRGLLCDPCNRGLGFFRDNPQNLNNAYQYLINKGHYG